MKKLFRFGCFGGLGLIAVIALLAMCASPREEPTPVAVEAPAVVEEDPVSLEEPAEAEPEEVVVEPDPTPTAEPTPLPDPIVFMGTGEDISQDFTAYPLVIAEMTHDGQRNFSVWLKDAETGENIDLMVNVIGSYNGISVAPVDRDTLFYDITADGSWSITTYSPFHFDVHGPGGFSGQGDSIILYQHSGGRANVSMSHVGERNFGVWLYRADNGQRVDLLANQIGTWEGRKAVSAPEGLYLIDITADGEWNITIE